MAMGNMLIAIAVVAVLVAVLLGLERYVDKLIAEERIRICADIVAHADEFEHAEIAITPDHLREIAVDIERGEK